MNNLIWMPREEVELREKYFKERQHEWEAAMFWGILPEDKRTEEEKYRDYLKWAWVVIAGESKMLFVHNENMKAYKTEGYDVISPLEEVKYDEFKRWCTTFDL